MKQTPVKATKAIDSNPKTNLSGYVGILALDPGLVTGFAIYHDEAIIIGTFPHYTELDFRIYEGWLVVIERPFMKASTDPIVFEVKGAILERCTTKKVDYIFQAATVPSFINTRYSEEMKTVKGIVHAKDALCHLIYLLTRQDKDFNVMENLKNVIYSPAS